MRRILSIDGGGIKGVFPAAFLATLEEATGLRIADYFDLIVGTSTGGIIAIGLGLGFSGSDLLRFYEHYGPQIFPKRHFAFLRRWFGEKYNVAPLRTALEEQFGGRLSRSGPNAASDRDPGYAHRRQTLRQSVTDQPGHCLPPYF